MQSTSFGWPATAVGTLAFVLVGSALADYDKAAEARYEAERKAQAEAARKAEAERQVQKARATAQAERQAVGKAAEGKSDAEVHALYEKRNADARAQALAVQAAMPATLAKAQAQQQAQQKRMQDPKFKADVEAGARMTGAKSMNDLMTMSDEDLRKLQAELEKKHGKN